MDFKRLYSKKLTFGNKTAIANELGCSEEYVSKITRFGGEACPMEKGWGWLCVLFRVNPAAADAIYETLTQMYTEMRHKHNQEANAQQTAAALVKVAAEAVAALITDCGSDDEMALLDLKVAVEKAIEQCHVPRKAKSVTKLKGVR